jgi:hypothetical protein
MFSGSENLELCSKIYVETCVPRLVFVSLGSVPRWHHFKDLLWEEDQFSLGDNLM